VQQQQVIYLAILVVAFGLLITEKLRNDVVAVMIIVALFVTHTMDARGALSGFSSEPAIVVAAIFVLTAALHQTGVSELLSQWVGRLAGSSFNRAIVVIMPSVALLSAFTHHVTTTAAMMPVTLNLAREKDIPASRLLMPLSFAASLGTTITIIGAPAFLVASAVLKQAGRPGLGIFSIAPIGLALSLVGTVYVLLVGRFLLPSHKGQEASENRFRLEDYFTELKILPGSPFVGKTVEEAESNQDYSFRVAGWVRKGRRMYGPWGDRTLGEGDTLLVRTTPEDIVAFRENSGTELAPVQQYGIPSANGHENGAPAADNDEEDVADRLVQVVVAPRSDLVGRTLSQVDFRRRYGALVVGLWRKDGLLQEELAQTRLQAGDVLVLQGDEDALQRMSGERAFLMMVPFQGETRRRGKMLVAAGIMVFTVIAASLSWLTIDMAAVAGALLMVLTRCITSRQAYRAIDARIYVFIAGAIPLGDAMEKTGTSKLLAGWLQAAVGGWSPLAILLAIYAIVAVLTQFMSDSGTTALIAPIAAALAQALGQPPEAFVVTVAMASVVAFLTPIGHHGNLLIYGPGRYQFGDFVKVGTPLTAIAGIVVSILALIIWHA
jgi:di/tricarboxylate transporter